MRAYYVLHKIMHFFIFASKQHSDLMRSNIKVSDNYAIHISFAIVEKTRKQVAKNNDRRVRHKCREKLACGYALARFLLLTCMANHVVSYCRDAMMTLMSVANNAQSVFTIRKRCI
jgi:hypothetical protein